MKKKEITHIGELTPDPRNVRRHSPRNLGAVVNSLHKVGAARSIVIDENNVILAGNCTVDACGEAGIENVKVVEVDGNTLVAVRRTGLSAKQKHELAIADNRTTDLGAFDADELAKVMKEFEIDAKDIEFTQAELDELANIKTEEPDDSGTRVNPGEEKYMVIVTCRDERQQVELLERFQQEKLECRALIG